MTPEIKSFLDNLPDEWNAIKQQAVKYFDDDSDMRKDGAAQIFKRPWIAPLNFGLLLFPPVKKEFIILFEQRTGKAMPSLYKSVLLQMNGCFAYDFSLYGLPESMYQRNLLDRSFLQQYDLGAANMHWIYEYEVNDRLFHIGSRAYSFEENVGYFIDGENNILSIKTNGEQIRKWNSFESFLLEEIQEAEILMIKEKNL
jgi:hypothetical protein